MENKATLTTGKYSIEFSGKVFDIYSSDEGKRAWICGASDPATAMNIVEGLIMVEMKRFYHPEATPTVNNAPVPPFLKK